jgi:hypothetical protein
VSTETYNLYSCLISAVGLTVAILAAIAVYRQIRQASQSLATSSLMAVLGLEEALGRSRAEYSDSLVEASRFRAETEKLPEASRKSQEPFFAILQHRIAEKLEQYLNALDRLCACIVRGDVNEERYRQDYRAGIQDVMDSHADLLGANTRHPNVVKVHQAWQVDRSAVDPRFQKLK